MSADRPERAVVTTRNWQYWLMLVGAFLCMGDIFTSFLGVALESDLLQAIGLFGIFAGYVLYCFPEYLRLQIWPWLAMSLLFALAAAIAMLIHNTILALICGLASLGFLCLAHGLRW